MVKNKLMPIARFWRLTLKQPVKPVNEKNKNRHVATFSQLSSEFKMCWTYKPYNGYYLVPDMDTVGLEEKARKFSRNWIMIALTVLICGVVFLFIIIFVVFPLIFMNSVGLQRLIIFTHLNLPNSQDYYENYRFPGYKNRYIKVQDLEENTTKSLGVWQILPVELAYKAIHDKNFDYEEALLNSNYSVIIYFHGTGEVRSDNTRKYQLLSYYFHVIAFDYRSYGDSSKGILSEKAVVNDCVQVYNWVLNNTNSPIYVWGHSLGAAIATKTVVSLKVDNNPKGLILESAFTSLRNELYVHPYGKLFAWLPWFKATVLDPLYRNGFIFDTATNIENVTCPIMIFHAEDDEIVPYKFGKKLYEIASHRPQITENMTIYHQFAKDLGYNHHLIYQDPFVKYYIMDFLIIADEYQQQCQEIYFN